MFGLDIIGGLLSKKPSVPKLTGIQVQDEQSKAIQGNINQLPKLETLATGVNQFNLEQLQKMLDQAIPGFDKLTSGISSNIESLMKGEIPKDVSDAIERSDAVKSLAGGYSGSGMHGNLTARDLGTTSLSLIQTGLNSAQSWLKTMDSIIKPTRFDVSSMFITPQFQTQADIAERDTKFNYNWMKNQLSSAYDPMNIIGNSLINTDAQLAQIASSIAGSAAGKMI